MRFSKLFATVCLLFGMPLVGTASYAEPYHARVLVTASQRIEVRTDLIASVAKAPFEAGMEFRKGDVLIAFNCARYEAELQAAKAGAQAAHVEMRSKRNLVRNGAAGRAELQIARAEAARSDADVAARQARLADCEIKAPFSGRVVSVGAGVFEMPSPNEPIITILDDSNLELELVVPSKWITWLSERSKFDLLIDETGETHRAEIVRIGAEVDPVSQTIKAFGRLTSARGRVLAGMSGQASFSAGGS